MSVPPPDVPRATALAAALAAAQEVDDLLSDQGPPFKLDGELTTHEAEHRLLVLHDCLTDVRNAEHPDPDATRDGGDWPACDAMPGPDTGFADAAMQFVVDVSGMLNMPEASLGRLFDEIGRLKRESAATDAKLPNPWEDLARIADSLAHIAARMPR